MKPPRPSTIVKALWRRHRFPDESLVTFARRWAAVPTKADADRFTEAATCLGWLGRKGKPAVAAKEATR